MLIAPDFDWHRPKQVCVACHTDGLRPCQAAQACLAFYLCANPQRFA